MAGGFIKFKGIYGRVIPDFVYFLVNLAMGTLNLDMTDLNVRKTDAIRIRPAEEEDFETIYSIWMEGVSNSFPIEEFDTVRLREKFVSNFAARQGVFNYWVATEPDGLVVGWQSLIRASNNPFREQRYAESSTYVARTHRHLGVGALLLEHAIKEAQKSQLEYVLGFVTSSNQATRKITREQGWQEIGTIPSTASGNNSFQQILLIRVVK